MADYVRYSPNQNNSNSEVTTMTQTYSIFIGDKYIATTEAGDATFACFEAAKTIAEYTNQIATLVDNTNGMIIASSNDEDDDLDLDEEWGDGGNLEAGFDPYEGCYTYDC
jgi:hypothetical protein